MVNPPGEGQREAALPRTAAASSSASSAVDARSVNFIGVYRPYYLAYYLSTRKMWPVTGAGPSRPDLAAMLHPLTQALIAAELPVLAAHGLSMWGYAVLSALDGGPVRTQATLAEQIGADKTRIISTLDRLQAAGLISREPDACDRRVRLLSITPAGRRVHASAQAGIRANEEQLLALLPPADRSGFLCALQALARLSRDEIAQAIQPQTRARMERRRGTGPPGRLCP